MWDNIKKVNICVTGFLEGEENDKGAGKKKKKRKNGWQNPKFGETLIYRFIKPSEPQKR